MFYPLSWSATAISDECWVVGWVARPTALVLPLQPYDINGAIAHTIKHRVSYGQRQGMIRLDMMTNSLDLPSSMGGFFVHVFVVDFADLV